MREPPTSAARSPVLARVVHAGAGSDGDGLEGGQMELEWAQDRAARVDERVPGIRIPWRRSRTILLVEHDETIRRMFVAALRRDGHHVVEVANGDDAFDWLGPGVVDGELERIPDLVVSAVHVPFFSGLEILERLRSCARPIPVVLITSRPDAETRVEASRLGAACLLERPFEPGELRAAVRRALRASGSRPQGAHRASA